jgi:hypothetical protein
MTSLFEADEESDEEELIERLLKKKVGDLYKNE